MNKKDTVVLYVHGKGGNTLEAEHYKVLFQQEDIYGFDYKSENPWDAKEEFAKKVEELKAEYESVILLANSIGAFFPMNAGIADSISKAYFISPIANMEQLIMDMMSWAGVTEEELADKKIIKTDFGEDLSWDYLQYVREHPISWNVETEILYGSTDHLQSIHTIREFAKENHAGVTVMEGGEHWFHTEEQMNFLDEWLRSKK